MSEEKSEQGNSETYILFLTMIVICLVLFWPIFSMHKLENSTLPSPPQNRQTNTILKIFLKAVLFQDRDSQWGPILPWLNWLNESDCFSF